MVALKNSFPVSCFLLVAHIIASFSEPVAVSKQQLDSILKHDTNDDMVGSPFKFQSFRGTKKENKLKFSHNQNLATGTEEKVSEQRILTGFKNGNYETVIRHDPSPRFKSKLDLGLTYNSGLKMPTAGRDICDRYDVDGCSIPFHLPFFYKTLFTPSCDRHDVCYHCGVAYDLTRLDCDNKFLRNMRNSCLPKNYTRRPWKSFSPKDMTITNTQAHRQIMIKHITDLNLNSMREIFLQTLSEFTDKFKGKIQILKSPKLLESIKENILLKWIIHLSKSIKNAAKTYTNAGNNYSQENTEYYTLLRLDNSKFSYDREGISDFLNNVLSKNQLDNVSGNSLHIKHVRILKAADEVTMHLHGYRASDIIDLEDVDEFECYVFADLYYEAVRVFGASSYKNTAEFFCHESFVPKCLQK